MKKKITTCLIFALFSVAFVFNLGIYSQQSEVLESNTLSLDLLMKKSYADSEGTKCKDLKCDGTTCDVHRNTVNYIGYDLCCGGSTMFVGEKCTDPY